MSSNQASLRQYKSRRTNPIYHFVWGMRFFLAGLQVFVRHPSLLALSLIPIGLTVAVLLLMAFGLAWLIGELLAGFMGEELRLLAQAIIFVFALMLGYFLYLPLARVLLAPFSEAISRQTHKISTANSGFGSDANWLRAMTEGLKIALLHIAIGSAALLLSLAFPPVGTPIGIVVAIFLTGLDFLDVPLSARGLPFGKKLGIVGRNKSLALGFGAASYLSLLIPGINLILLPVGVIGATLLTAQIDLD
ncbi:MAG: EI24 domain-containing protein [Blastocatellales bacterium]